MTASNVTDIPTSMASWETIKQARRAELWRRLGDIPPAFRPDVRIVSREQRAGYTVEKLEFVNGLGATVYGYQLLPEPLAAPVPAVLYLHAHGANYTRGKDELFQPGRRCQEPGPVLARTGYAVLAVDAYGFGERLHQGPAGSRESGVDAELSLAKKMLWEGRTLWGMILHDDLLALTYLVSRPDIDQGRIAAVGMSMGGSRATWLSALDDRIRLTVPICQMTRYADFAEQGDFALHGIYYYVPGMLASGMDMEHIVSLTAPRPQTILIGDQDPLSPIGGVRAIDRYVRETYRALGAEAAYSLQVFEGTGHEFTPEIFAAMQAALQKYL